MATIAKLVSGVTVTTSDLYIQDVKGGFTLMPNKINLWAMNRDQLFFPFTFKSFDITTSSNIQIFMDYIDSLRPGCAICVIIVGDLGIPSAARSILFSVFESFGGAKISQVDTTKPNYCLLGYKGQNTGQATEVVGLSTSTNPIQINQDMGKSKSWNTKTIQITTYSDWSKNPVLYVNGVATNVKVGIGFNVITFDRTHKVNLVYTFDTNAPLPAPNPAGAAPTPSQLLSSFLNNLDESTLTLIFTYGQTKDNLTQDTVNTIKQTFGSRFIQDFYNSNQCWYLVGKKEDVNPYAEATTPRTECTGYYFYTLEEDFNYVTEYDDDGDTYLSMYSNNYTGSSFNNYAFIDDIDFTKNKSFEGFLLGDYDPVNNVLIELQYLNMALNNTQQQNIGAMIDFVNAINAIPTGNLVIVSACKLPTSFVVSDPMKEALDTIGSCCSDSIKANSSFALIGRKGSPSGSAVEDISNTGPVFVSSNFNSKTNLLSPSIVIKVISNNSIIGDNGSEFFINGRQVPFTKKPGMNVLVVDPMNGNITMTKSFNTVRGLDTEEESNQLSQFIESLPVGSIVALSSQGSSLLNQRAKDTISRHLKGNIGKHQLESNSIYNLNENQSYCSIGQVIDIHNNNDDSISPLFSESLSNNNQDEQSSCLLHYPLDYLFQDVEGYNINVKSKAGLNPNAEIQINGLDIVANNSCNNGLNVVVIKPGDSTHSIHQFNVVDDENQWFTFFEFIYSLPLYTLVVIAIHSSFGQIKDQMNKYYKRLAFKMIGGSLYNASEASSYAMIGYKGIASSSAHELSCSKSSLISISSWEPKYRNTDDEMKQVKRVVGRDALFSVPLFEHYYRLSNPVPTIPKSKALGHKYSIAPALSEPIRERVGATPVKRALIVSVSYTKSLAGKLLDAEYHAQQHAQALIGAGYIAKENVKVISESTTEPAPSGYIGPSWQNISSQITNWLQSNIVAGDTVYFAFIGRGFDTQPFGRPEVSNWNGGYAFLSQDLKQNAFILYNNFQTLFNKVTTGINLTFLLDCDYSYEIGVYNSNTPPPYPWNSLNVLSSLGQGKKRNKSQQGSGFMECINYAISEQFNSGGAKLTYSQLIAKVKSYPWYLNEEPTYEGNNPNLTFLNPIQ